MKNIINHFIDSADRSILGKTFEVKLALACFLSQGHLLIEDVPGTGKTTFAKTMAKLLDLSFARIQFTNDLMPADLVGISIFDSKSSEFKLVKGAIFHQFILADELNRGSPKTQSALLEAMEEQQVTLDGNTIELEKPFFVVATQNPRSQIGTHSLPESQLDRFMMKFKLGHPSQNFERDIISTDTHKQNFLKMSPVIKGDELNNLIQEVGNVKVSEKILNYVLEILELSRSHENFRGLSSRAGRDIIKASKAWAFINGRNFVLPDDIQLTLPFVISHRLSLTQGLSFEQDQNLVQNLLTKVTID
jgi:MoxR-like ATPase